MSIACEAPKPTQPPNIVLIISDDHGWPDFGFMGSPIVKTPHIDALAEEGVVLSHGYNTGSTCRASLRTLLTGFHPLQMDARKRAISIRERKNVRENHDILLFQTLPGLLAERGYSSFQAGKYWEGSFEMGGFTHGMKSHVATARYADRDDANLSSENPLGFGRESMQPLWDFLDQHQAGRSQHPFFVWFAPMLPHAPYDAPEKFRAAYNGASLSKPALDYYANITRFDARVGELLEQLDSRDLRDDTLVVFLSDNGWLPPSGDSYDQTAYGGAGGKASLEELGFRTPIIFRWPDQFENGRRHADLVSTADIFPTLLELAGTTTPTDRPGKSLLPLLNDSGEFARTNVIAGVNLLRGHLNSTRAPHEAGSKLALGFLFRNSSWSYSWNKEQDRDRLYQVVDGEVSDVDVAEEFPEIRQRLRKKITTQQKRLVEMSNPPIRAR